MIVGIIPAKSGSKRLKNKNIKYLNHKPLIYWTIKYAKSKLLDKLYVSTNSKKISTMMRKYKIPVIKRPIKLCGEAPIIDVYKHAFKKINKNIKIIVGLQPDHPDRNKKLDDVINKFQKKREIFYIADKKNKKNGAHYILSKKIILGGKIRKELKVVDNCTNIHFFERF